MNTTFIGIDLAWKSARNPTGAAELNSDHSGARLEILSTLAPEASVAEFIRANATANTVVAIDAPLVIVNEAGQRACETAVGKRYGSREASCHTSNLRLYRDASSMALTTELMAMGFTHVDPATTQQNARIMAEVYPHAAMVALWDLPKTLKYKRGSLAAKRVGLNMLRVHLIGLGKAEPPLLKTGVLTELLTTDLNELVGQSLKNHEDWLDALFCAYLAYYFWYWGWERNELFGDIESGYILNPKLQSLHANSAVENKPSYQTATFKDPSSTTPDALADYTHLIDQAHQLARPIKTSEDCSAASVASVIVSRSGKTYTGVCLDFSCSLGFCAEHAAIAEMLKAHESEIAMVVAVDEHGTVLPPCGRCREMMWQLNPRNKDAVVVLARDRSRPLHDLLPER